ncbi:AAA family ATPase [bacterium]|jgi:proteasome-associated ATPase|nr:AAA family ATPase [Verrucomicrobiales bacterium]MDB4507784.1 AAA family ATPase [bacterium]MDF1787353.1 AAA family ATPase [Verrucomicrobiales bacterium]
MGGSIPVEELDKMSTLQVLDLVQERLKFMGVPSQDHQLLRRRVEEMEEIQDQARETLEKLSNALDKLRSPALRVGTFLEIRPDGTACVMAGGTEYVCAVDPTLDKSALETGTRVALNEAFALIGILGLDTHGPILKVTEVLADGRLRLGQENGAAEGVVKRAPHLRDVLIKEGHEVRLDVTQRIALEVLGKTKRTDRALTEVPPTPWEAIGGQETAVKGIRNAVELPYLHGDLFEAFQHPVPKGFLLYGPPGCGKTLLGRATAYNLRQQIKQKDGVDRPDFFLHVKGPEILNMWLGESERQVRDLFQQCREKAAEGHLAFLFIDEAEAVLGTRNGGRMGSTILNTLVPMFCTEMDGLEALNNVVVILASNRADLIDPAILRPGRIDRKIRVLRPDKAGAEAIYRIYLGKGIPLDKPVKKLAKAITERHFERSESSRFLEVTFRSGKTNYLHRGDLASGAMIESIVERAKEFAIGRSIESEKLSPLSLADLELALTQEYAENELFPPSDLTEDWLKLTDFDPSNVVKLAPFSAKLQETAMSNAI